MQPDPLAESARGWHNIQLAVMGFIGLCGVLQMGDPPAGPKWLEWWSAGMAIVAFASSLISTWMVGGVAFPVMSGEMPANAAGRLKGGVSMTFVSIALMVLSSAGGWWPASENAGSIEVKGKNGASACGTWVDGAPAGFMWIDTAKGRVTVELAAVAQMNPVSGC